MRKLPLIRCYQFERWVLSALLLLLSLISLAHAQWSKTGFDLPTNAYTARVLVKPDSTGGFWFAEHYEVGIRDYVRIQRYDSDGYSVFVGGGISVIPDTVDSEIVLESIISGPNNTLWVIYDDLTAGRKEGVYFQQFSPTGERLLGDKGRFLGADDFSFSGWENGFSRDGTFPDGEGGVWFVGHQNYTTQLFLTGIHADGTVKFPPMFIGYMDIIYDTCIFADDSSGVYVFWNEDDQFHVQRVAADGSKRFADAANAPVVLDLSLGDNDFTTSDGSGGVYLHLNLISEQEVIQRVLPDGTAPWGIDGYIRNWGAGVNARAACTTTLSDGSIIFGLAMRHEDFSYSYYLSRLHPSGTFSIEPGTNPLLDRNYDFINRAALFPAVEFPNAFLFLTLEEIVGPDTVWDDNEYVEVHLIDGDSGKDLWGEGHTRLDVPEVRRSSMSIISCYQLPDNSILIYATHGDQDIIHGYAHHRIYKMRQDGTLVDALDVPETPANATLPNRVEILSAWPNPFNASVTITYSLPTPASTVLTIYDLTGREVQHVRLASLAGEGKYVWQPRSSLASGIYFASLSSGNKERYTKLVLIR